MKVLSYSAIVLSLALWQNAHANTFQVQTLDSQTAQIELANPISLTQADLLQPLKRHDHGPGGGGGGGGDHHDNGPGGGGGNGGGGWDHGGNGGGGHNHGPGGGGGNGGWDHGGGDGNPGGGGWDHGGNGDGGFPWPFPNPQPSPTFLSCYSRDARGILFRAQDYADYADSYILQRQAQFHCHRFSYRPATCRPIGCRYTF